MKKNLATLIVIGCLQALPAFADTKPPRRDELPQFDIICKSSTGNFSIHAQSKSNDVAEDDMTLTLKQDGYEILLPLKIDWYKVTGSIQDKTKLKSICRVDGSANYEHDYPGFELSPTRVLLFFRKDSRPGFDLSSVVLYDPQNKKVLDKQEQMAFIKEGNMVFRSSPHGVDQRLVRSEIKNSGCDCAEASLEDWLPIRTKGTKLTLGWRK